MTELELQTLIRNACKAAGWEIKSAAHDMPGAFVVWIYDAPVIVNPAHDDGDSRMLQVACKIALHFEVIGGKWCAEAYSQEDGHGDAYCALERLQYDARKAARIAVLRCAAMIGEAVP